MAKAGLPVTLVETTQEQALASKERIEQILRKSSAFKKGRMTEEHLQQTVDSISIVTDFSTLSEVDIVIEAAFENLDIKKKVFSQLDKVCKAEAILATNTSFMNIDEIAAATSRPSNVIGTRTLQF